MRSIKVRYVYTCISVFPYKNCGLYFFPNAFIYVKIIGAPKTKTANGALCDIINRKFSPLNKFNRNLIARCTINYNFSLSPSLTSKTAVQHVQNLEKQLIIVFWKILLSTFHQREKFPRTFRSPLDSKILSDV